MTSPVATLPDRLPSDDARIRVGATDLPTDVDVLVIGLGITGAGVALDAASRGLKVLAVDARDIAWGTSRFSSKLVHGGLRYLANGQIGVAHESAVERGILMQSTAPHLVHTLPMLIPLTPSVPTSNGVLARVGVGAGDLLRVGARTPKEFLPRSRKINAAKTLELAPVAKRGGLRGGVLSYDGQLEDDARLVVTMARTAVAYGADVRTRLKVVTTQGTSAVLLDEAGAEHVVSAKAVISATGVWAGDLDPAIKLRPSRGTHIVVRSEKFPGVNCAVMAPVPGHTNRFVFALPQQDGTFYIGLTDEEVDIIPDVPEVPEADVDFLLEVINSALESPLTKADVVGAYAGLRPLLQSEGTSADLSRKHAVLTSQTGLITIVGGKLTTYRQMAQDAVDKAVELAHLEAGPCQTKHLPLLGAAPRWVLSGLSGGDKRLVRRFGTDAKLVLQNAIAVTGLSPAELLAPAAEGVPATLAEFIFAVTHEGATTVEDILDRRTRIGLIPADAEAARPAAERALALGERGIQG